MNTPQHPNIIAIREAVIRWVAEAQVHPDGVYALRRRVAWVEDQIQALGLAAAANRGIPQHLKGLTVVDLIVAADDLMKAASDLAAKPATYGIEDAIEDAAWSRKTQGTA